MRFPEFSGEWERCKVKDFTKVVAGATPSTSNKEYWGGDIRWMNSGELNLKRVYEVQGRITQLGYEKTSTKIIPPQSVLIGLAGQGKTRGTAAINYVELCTNQSIASILPSDKYYPEFLYQNIESRYKELRDISSGDGGRGGLNLQMIYNLNIPYCSISEQRKIGDFLCLLDQRIETQRKIIEDLKKLKDAISVRLFTSATCGKRELSDLATIVMGQSPSSQCYNTNNEGLPLIQGNLDITKGKLTPRIYSSEVTKKCQAGDVILTVRAPVGEVAIADFGACIGRGVCAIKPFDDTLSVLIYQFLQYFKPKWFSLEQGSTFTSVSRDDIMSIKVAIPSIQAIETLNILDKKITIEDVILNNLNFQKKILINQMFI